MGGKKEMIMDTPSWFQYLEWHKHYALRPTLPAEGVWNWNVFVDEYHQTGITQAFSDVLKEQCWAMMSKYNEAITPLDFYTPSDKMALTRCSVKVGLCTCLLNRAHQVKIALPMTIANIWRHREWAKIYLVDFGSDDGIIEWIKENLGFAMGPGGCLQVFECKELPVGKF